MGCTAIPSSSSRSRSTRPASPMGLARRRPPSRRWRPSRRPRDRRIDRMKRIDAYIRHEAFEPIRAELLEKGFPSLSISEVKGSGRQKGVVEHYRGSTLTVNVRPKLKLEIVV